jgi:hypothetical protein
LDKCVECGKWFKANNENAVDVKILGLIGTAHKECAEKLLKNGKARMVHEGGVKFEK